MRDRRTSDLKPFPRHESDAAAERFVDEADLTEYDFSGFQPGQFEFARKEARVNMRLPASMLEAVKASAAARGIPYQRFIREAIARALSSNRP
ncbi:BrnA antitoxin family protein [uncultured Rhodospira sp.]|uniref:BrnA antitoxin family protein n=1 Tax=uncultured Rhodospira sp. TaxID=1936189 RepID=UPI00262A0A99|nr:BrnA antitoxin family protein [uncultured Rhodospira sp.]